LCWPRKGNFGEFGLIMKPIIHFTKIFFYYSAVTTICHGMSTNHFFGNEIEKTPPNTRMNCQNCVPQCRPDTFPNIGQGFRGYNLILGDSLAIEGDPGYKNHIFDEETERRNDVRFSNTAGYKRDQCDATIYSDFLSMTEDFLSSVTTINGDGSKFNVGADTDVSVSAKGVEVSGNIPPLYQSMNSNSKITNEVSKGFFSQEMKVTRTKSSCTTYEFTIKEAQHPVLTTMFEDALKALDICLKDLTNYDSKTTVHDDCVRLFFDNYGTHYLENAVFGSKLSVLTVMKGEVLNHFEQSDISDCAKQDTTWSFMGLFGGGHQSEKCKNSVFGESEQYSEMVQEKHILTVGSRPAEKYSEWAGQDEKPEIIFKKVSPISDLMTEHFLCKDGSVECVVPMTSGEARMKEFIEKYTVEYCSLFPDHCNYITDGTVCLSGGIYSACDCDTQEKGCALYTGPLAYTEDDKKFKPHGDGKLTVNDAETDVQCELGVCEEIIIPGKSIKEINIKTSISDYAGCNGCPLSLKICDVLGTCCETGHFPGASYGLGAENTFSIEHLGGCEGVKLKEDDKLTVTIKHKGGDAWRASYIRVKLSDDTYRNCPVYQMVDDDQSMVLTCTAGSGPKNAVIGIITKTRGGCTWHAHNWGRDYCRVAAEICQMDGKNCCKTGTLNWGKDFVEGHVDTFMLDDCKASADVDASLGLKMTYYHDGGDAWEGEWTQVLLSDGIMKYCGGTGDLDDNNSKTIYCY